MRWGCKFSFGFNDFESPMHCTGRDVVCLAYMGETESEIVRKIGD